MKIALVHDQLLQRGGAENVLEIFARMYPDAPIYTLFYDPKRMGAKFPPSRVRPSFLNTLPGAKNHYQWYLTMMPLATESYDLRGFDVVLSSASAFAKGALIHPGTKHICYCHTPTRYLWSDTHTYINELKRSWIVKLGVKPFLPLLRMWDRQAADRVDAFIANSNTVGARIKQYYHRDSEVIYPPVDLKKFSISPKIGNYFLVGGRLVGYKRFDLVVRAFSQTGIPLKVFGEGPELKNLKKIAKNNVEFLGAVDDAAKAELYRNARAFIHPHVEDFGITAVESMASGRPVIAFGVGGAVETVVPGKTGIFMEEQIWEDLADIAIRFKDSDWNPAEIRKHAEQFSEEHFEEQIQEAVRKATQA
jgi:glycosyltransferase involved in cell wall biosynthesis